MQSRGGECSTWHEIERHSNLLEAYYSVIDEIRLRLGGIDRQEAEELADLDGTPVSSSWRISIAVGDVCDDWLLVEVES